ncbi:catechol 2,3-dioxygenase-like lactoylglutathione lyase family enzyme [Chitinophaga niastensis]|uniref:Catechol 2,3-dioxygenase-like lactoylglutathione lyase family enzyme n=1 Tax=Chitinophaga niastensis TaxID=536980 RepID=A0A2P8HVT9_CHINA|nr:VOC family protein [Chitinophaga niastensis]PSL50342.1 catechol 2,3-dioxygenase-like lactoylglutathione lyase family enzyme [Chitinophaga niastensis]
MISKMTHVSIYVLNQDSAYDFYTNKLGFKVIKDVPMGNDDRWITVCPPEQPGFEIILSPVNRGLFSPEAVKALKELIEKGTFGVGLFTCNDIFATYEELKAKGVEFTKAPKKEFYGTEAIFKDDSGNWFSLAQLV